MLETDGFSIAVDKFIIIQMLLFTVDRFYMYYIYLNTIYREREEALDFGILLLIGMFCLLISNLNITYTRHKIQNKTVDKIILLVK